MAVTGMSFFYEKEKIDVLQKAAKTEDRSTSGYIQKVLQDYIDSTEAAPTKKRVLKKRK